MCPCVDVVDVASLCTLFVLSLVHFSLSTLLSCRTRLCIHPLTPTHNHVIVLFLAARFALWLYLYLFLFLTFCLFVCVFVCLCSFPPACRSVLWWWWADRVSTPSERALFHGPQMARSRFFIIDGSFCSFSDDPSIMNRTTMMIHQFRNNHSKPLRNHQSNQSQKTLDILLCPPNSVGLWRCVCVPFFDRPALLYQLNSFFFFLTSFLPGVSDS